MSKIVNTEGYKPGSIYRIACENFVTYKQVELFPGPCLNMIIGPNGTGKSTFVCAIILGLCGSTSVIGRAKKISEYVRTGSEEAVIELELYREHGETNVVITRQFNLRDVTKWRIDQKPATQAQVQKLIQSFNIQVDNLCQLLPQDRVESFAQMNPQELLRSTLAATGQQASVNQLDQLIELRKEQEGLTTRSENSAQSLEEKKRRNAELKPRIEAMTERRDIETEIDICAKKKLWLEYNDLKNKTLEVDKDRKRATKVVETHMKNMAPLKQAMDDAKQEIKSLEQAKLKAGREINQIIEDMKRQLQKINRNEYAIDDLKNSLENKLKRQKERERDIFEARVKLQKLETDKMRLVTEIGDEQTIKMQIQELDKTVKKTTFARDNVNKMKTEVQHNLEANVMVEIRMNQNVLRGLQDVADRRLESLRAHSEDAHRAVMWLRKHRDLFHSRTVHEPIMLELNFTEQRFARYLAALVPARDLVAFTFESKEDMNVFLSKVRVSGARRVNAVCSPPAAPPAAAPPLDRSLGFYTYVVDTLSAPAAIVRYLCRVYNVHRIPIGDRHTYDNNEHVPPRINMYFTENHMFVSRTSAYSKQRSTTVRELGPPGLLAITLDVDATAATTHRLEELQKQADALKNQTREYDKKLQMLDSNLNEFSNQRMAITSKIDQVKQIDRQIHRQRSAIEDIEGEQEVDERGETERTRKEQGALVRAQGQGHAALQARGDDLASLRVRRDLYQIKLEFNRNANIQKESELTELENEVKESQKILHNIEALEAKRKSEAKEKLLEARGSCQGKMPGQDGFPYTAQFAALPANLSALLARAADLAARLHLMADDDADQIIREYDEREREIAALEAKVTNSSRETTQLVKKINDIKSQWLPPLEALIQCINKKFSEIFANMKCAGEITLVKEAGDEEFSKYGVGVWVAFRSGEPLAQLTRHAQSGGERSFATAGYLISVQALAQVPFRCVDEINQGMDELNERKLFEMLTQVTTQGRTGQYFLLTPKLLRGINYNPKIMVHTIMSGKYLMNCQKWNFDRFLEKATAKRRKNRN